MNRARRQPTLALGMRSSTRRAQDKSTAVAYYRPGAVSVVTSGRSVASRAAVIVPRAGALRSVGLVGDPIGPAGRFPKAAREGKNFAPRVGFFLLAQ